jgi:hypothetical protein
MSDQSDERETPASLEPIPYADPSLPIGPTGYTPMSYPSDCAGFFNPAQFTDDGTVLRLRPGPTWSRVLAAFAFALAFSLFLIFINRAHARASKPAKPIRAAVIGFVMAATVCCLPYIDQGWKRRRKPWIEVDRHKKRIILPREHTMIAYGIVIRLQVVSFTKVGLSVEGLRYRGEPRSGEMQIVFQHDGKTQTRSVVSNVTPNVLKQFAKAFTEETAVPISRVIRLVNGDWVARPLLTD